jgi:hypothetical protein
MALARYVWSKPENRLIETRRFIDKRSKNGWT